MEEEILNLVKLLQQQLKSSNNDLSQRFSSDPSLKLGLQQLYFTLKQGIQQIDEGKLGFQTWNSSQIQALISIVSLFLSSIRSVSFEQTEPLIVAIVEKSLEFSLCVLEKSAYNNGDLSIQNNVVQLLEIALVDGFDKESFDVVHNYAVEELLPIVQARSDGVELDYQIRCSLQDGSTCLREGVSVDQVLMTLTSEFLQPDSQTTSVSEPAVSSDLNTVISLAGHIAVVHQ